MGQRTAQWRGDSKASSCAKQNWAEFIGYGSEMGARHNAMSGDELHVHVLHVARVQQHLQGGGSEDCARAYSTTHQDTYLIHMLHT